MLSEFIVPPPLYPYSVDPGDLKGKGDTLHVRKHRWEVLECVGFPLPKAFSMSSSLGSLGKFNLSRCVWVFVRGAIRLTLEWQATCFLYIA